MTEYETLRVERSGSALILNLYRPERRNAVSLQMMADIIAAF